MTREAWDGCHRDGEVHDSAAELRSDCLLLSGTACVGPGLPGGEDGILSRHFEPEFVLDHLVLVGESRRRVGKGWFRHLPILL